MNLKAALARTDVWLAVASMGLIGCLAADLLPLMTGLMYAPSDGGRSLLVALGDFFEMGASFFAAISFFVAHRRVGNFLMALAGMTLVIVGMLVLLWPLISAFGKAALIAWILVARP